MASNASTRESAAESTNEQDIPVTASASATSATDRKPELAEATPARPSARRAKSRRTNGNAADSSPNQTRNRGCASKAATKTSKKTPNTKKTSKPKESSVGSEQKPRLATESQARSSRTSGGGGQADRSRGKALRNVALSTDELLELELGQETPRGGPRAGHDQPSRSSSRRSRTVGSGSRISKGFSPCCERKIFRSLHRTPRPNQRLRSRRVAWLRMRAEVSIRFASIYERWGRSLLLTREGEVEIAQRIEVAVDAHLSPL